MDNTPNSLTGYREEYEQEIDLKDLLFYILYRWRSLLLAAIIVCVLAGGYVLWYNGVSLLGKREDIQVELEEQQRLVKEAQDSGQSADAAQKQVKQLEEELEGLKKYSFVKYSVIGFGGGLLALGFYYGVSYVLSDRMRGERELKEMYHYYLLGTFPRLRGRKPFTWLDRFLERMEGNSEQLTQEEAYRIVAVNITNLARDGGTFLVTGTVHIEQLQEFTKAILSQLQENISLLVGADMNMTASTLEMLAECDGVILVEERNQSFRRKIQREQESIAALEKAVVGYVVL